MMEDWVTPDIAQLLIGELSESCTTAAFVKNELPNNLSPDHFLDQPDFWGVVLWIGGGYNTTFSGSSSINPCSYSAQVMLHCYAASDTLSWGKISGIKTLLNSPTEQRRACRILSGPYQNPHPAHPYASRTSMQFEVSVYNEYKAVIL